MLFACCKSLVCVDAGIFTRNPDTNGYEVWYARWVRPRAEVEGGLNLDGDSPNELQKFKLGVPEILSVDQVRNGRLAQFY